MRLPWGRNWVFLFRFQQVDLSNFRTADISPLSAQTIKKLPLLMEQDKLGFAAVTHGPQVSEASDIKGLFPTHSVYSPVFGGPGDLPRIT